MDSIRVGVRVRPLLKREFEAGLKNSWSVSSNCITHKSPNPQSYCFDNVFHGEVKTADIFTTMALPIVHSVMEGFNGTIFVYGQTSSGKTHTMMGASDDPGIVPLTIQEIFSYIEQTVKREFILRLSYLEIYNETLTDLLNPENKNLKIRENTEHTVSVHGLTECAVTLTSEVADLLCYGEQNRVTGETNMNERSSRSHTIVTMAIESRERDEEEEEGGEKDGPVKVSSINLVDLAGSERVSATGVEWTNVRFKEGTFINLSLLTLGNVIAKLSEGSSAHIPFRDSKLTRILQPSLGGNARTCIICTITPASVEETHSTLKFASRAKQVQNKPIVNEVVLGEAALVKKLKIYQKENDELKHKLAERLPEEEKAKLAFQLAGSEKEKNELEQKIKSLQDIIVRSSGMETLNPKTTAPDRRRTVCPALLTRAAQNIPRSLVHPTIHQSTPARNRHTIEMFSPLFSPHFDKTSFEKHLDSLEVTPVAVDKRHVKFVSRPSFIPNLQCTNLELSDGLESTTAGCMTAAGGHMVDTSAQTELLATTSVGTTPVHLGTHASCAPNINTSFMCEHRKQLLETLETAQFECDEHHIVVDQLRAENCKLQGDVEELKSTLSVHVTSQEERINDLQQQLASTRTAMQEKQTRIDQYETECNFMSTEVNELKLRLEGFQKSVEHGGRSEGNSVLEALKAELEAIRYKADQDAKHFQVCYEQKVLEVNKGNLKVSDLEDKLQDAYAELMSFESKVKEQSKTMEESKLKLQQYSVSLDEKEAVIASLNNDVTEAKRRCEEEVKKIRIQYEGYLKQSESYARDLQAKLSGRTSPESSCAKHTIAKLEADMQELQARYEGKTAEVMALQATVDALQCSLQSTKDQLEEKLSEGTGINNKSATPRRWAAVSFEEEAANSAQMEEVMQLTAQLKMATCELEEKKFAMAKLEESVRTLASQIETVTREKEVAIVQKEQCFEELQSRLEDSAAALEERKSALTKEEEKVGLLSCELDKHVAALQEKQVVVEEQMQKINELSSHLHRAIQDNESSAAALKDLESQSEHLTVFLKEKEDTISGQWKQILELQEQLKTNIAILEEKENECVSLQKNASEHKAQISEIAEKANVWEAEYKKKTEEVDDLCQVERRLLDEKGELETENSGLKSKLDSVTAELEDIRKFPELFKSTQSALEEKSLSAARRVHELEDELEEKSLSAARIQSRMNELENELEERKAVLDVHKKKIEECEAANAVLQTQLATATKCVEEWKSEYLKKSEEVDVKQKQLDTATKCAEEWKAEYLKKSEEVDVKQKQLATATKCAEEWKAEYLKKSEEVDVKQKQLATATKCAEEWKAEYLKKSEEVDDLCRMEKQWLDEKDDLLMQLKSKPKENDSSKQLESYQSQIVELKSALQSSRSEMETQLATATKCVEEWKAEYLKKSEEMDVKQKQLATATKCAEEWKAEYLKKSEEVDVKQKRLATATKCVEEWKAEYLKKSEEVDVKQKQLATATECAEVWKAEYQKKSEEVDDLCQMEKQWLDEKDDLLMQLKSKPKEIDSSKQLESYQSQIVELKSALQSSRSEMEAQLAKATERGDVWEAEYNKKAEEVDDLCRVERQLLDEKYELETANGALQSKLELAVKELAAAKQMQQAVPVETAISCDELYSCKALNQELQKENELLKSRLQSQALKPAGYASSSVANDGSGFVTGVAFYEMQARKHGVEKENERLIAKLEKVKAENVSLQTMLQKERDDVKRYRNERNLYRVKYEKSKGIDSGTSSNTGGSSPEKSKETQSLGSVPACVEDEPAVAVEAALEKCPTPRRSRKSILSYPTAGRLSQQCPKTEMNSNLPTTGKEKVVQFEGAQCSTAPTGVKSGTILAGQLANKESSQPDAVAHKVTAPASLSLAKEKDTGPAIGTAKSLLGGPVVKAVQRQPLTNVNSSEQVLKRKDEDKGRRSILSFPPDSSTATNPYLSVNVKKAKFEEDLGKNSQSSTAAEQNECKSQ